MGDCPQDLPLKLAIPELDDYLADCERKGFNLLWICMDGQRTPSPTSKPPQDQRGVLMMTNGWQIGNDTINTTAQHNIVQGIKDAGDTHLMTVNWRLSRPQGILTLTLSANPTIKTCLLHILDRILARA